MNRFFFLFVLLLSTPMSFAQTIDLTHSDTAVQSGHLKVGGKNPQGVEINATSHYLTLGGQPWFPVVGEFHFTRYPRADWEEELLKMKAGGINIVATYVFWIYHEEEEGQWDWTGNRDLRAFVELCQKHGLYCYPRLGPWAHGEVRNGGLPDWLLQKCGEKNVRTDAEPYLTYVHDFYGEIAKQLTGLLWKDGGPVIGLQIENELTNNPTHLLTLKNMARDLGMDVPLYTITGWMRVQFPENEMLPVFAGYADAFWSPQVKGWARESRVNYFFSHNRDDATIGADLNKEGDARPSEAMQRYPYGTVELGGGMQISYRRRPVIEADDIAALALVKIGSGSNMQGYYMYQGGANQLGKLSTLQETRATGYPNDLPVISYDFQAPLRQYGQRGPAYNALRVQHLFLHSFGRDLAPLPMTLPDQQPHGMDDRETLRWTARSDGQSGFLFVNNYQRVEGLPAHQNTQFTLKLKDGTLKVPSTPIDLPAQRYFIWPFNMDLNGVRLKSATAQPLCRIGDTFVFFALEGIDSEFVFDAATQSSEKSPVLERVKFTPGQLIPLNAKNGATAQVLLLSHEQAQQAYQANIWGAERLLISNCGLVFDGDTLRMQTRDPQTMSLLVYPPPPALNFKSEPVGIFAMFVPRLEAKTPVAQFRLMQPASATPAVKKDKKGVIYVPDDSAFEHAETWQVKLPPDVLDGAHEAFLQIHYTGDIARAYLGDRLIDDDFYFGREWEIGLRRFAPEILKKGLTLKILPLRKDAPIYIPKDRLPKFGKNGEAIGVSGITIAREYEVTLHR